MPVATSLRTAAPFVVALILLTGVAWRLSRLENSDGDRSVSQQQQAAAAAKNEKESITDLSSMSSVVAFQQITSARQLPLSSSCDSGALKQTRSNNLAFFIPHLLWQRRPANNNNKKKRFLIYLHGAGESGTDLSLLYLRPGANGSIPRLLFDHYSSTTSSANLPVWMTKFDLVIMPQSDVGWTSDATAERVNNLAAWYRANVLRSCRRSSSNNYNDVAAITEAKIFVTGVSNGGHGALRAASLRPGLYHYVASVCGFGSSSLCETILHGSSSSSSQSAETKLFLLHGMNDEIVPVRESDRIFAGCRTDFVANRTLLLPGDEADGKKAFDRKALDRLRVLYVRPSFTPDPDDEAGAGTGHGAWKMAYSHNSLLWRFFFAD